MSKNIHMLISKKAEEITENVINTRRHLHMYPELPGEEKETSSFISEKLNALGIEVQNNIGGYGVVGILNGAKKGATIAWRADMDACALQEENDKPYKSPPHGTDDFSCFQNELSGLFFFLGSANLDKGIKAWNHTSTFDIDEDCMVFGVKTMSSFLFEILSRRKN